MYGNIFDMVHTAFSYWRALTANFSINYSNVKESSLYIMWNAYTAFLLCVAVFIHSYQCSQMCNFAIWRYHNNFKKSYMVHMTFLMLPGKSIYTSAVPSKNAVSANIKHSRYFH